jgi:YVTN family beta-propeller protein
MEFLLLGPLEVRDGDEPVPLGGAKQRALLASLLLHTNEVIARDRLIDGLWGGQPPATAAHTVETYVSRLRRALHDAGSRAALITRPPGYMLRIDPEELDLNRFERLAGEGRRRFAEGNPEVAADLLRKALALFRGPPLDDVAFFPFAQAEVGRLEEMRLAALEDRIDADLAAGWCGELVGELDALVHVHPLRERLQAQLMLALYRAGRQADALEAFRAARRHLDEELGVEPGTSLRRLEQAILEHDASLEATPTGLERVSVESASRAEPAPAQAAAPPIAPADEKERPPSGQVGVPEPAIGLPAAHTGAFRSPPRRLVITLVALLVLASVAAGIAAVLHHGAPSLRNIRADAMGIIDPERGAIVGEVPLRGSPGRIVAGAGSVWVTDFNADTVSRIDGRQVRQVIPVGGGPSAITVGNGAVWVADALDGTVARVDPGTDRVVQTIPVGDGPSGIAYGEGTVWVANADDHTVVGIDAKTGQVTERVGLDASPTDVAVGSGAVWVTSHSAGVVFRISRDVRDVARIRVGTGPSAIAAGPGAVWVANTLDGTVSRIDPSREVVTATLEVGDGPAGIAVSTAAVWVTNEFARTVTRIDPRTPVVAQTVAVGNRPNGIAVTGGAVWVGVHGAAAAHRGGTLRIVSAIPRLDSIDPGIAFMLFPPQLLGMTNDGLVTLKHVGGSDGTQLVPDLAVSLPASADHGRSYRFEVRRGIRYSTGEPVRPEDFRRAIERDFRIGSPGGPFFADIVGADRCAGKGKPCDLSEGIAVDDQADTVTFRLTRPDPEFLYKLTLTFAFAVPPGTPDQDVDTLSVPATGPYLIDRYEPGRELRLVRNPQFHEWSPAAQPDGYPDQIVWRFGLDPQAAVTAVERGDADWGLYEFPFSPPGDRLTEIRTQYPGQTHVNPLPETEFFTLNTRVPPFDDVRVRRALNYAIDRTVLTSLYGSSDLARPTCQVLPPGLPGYQQYCPYTLNPRTDGAYTAPRLDVARSLVAASHTQGMPVRVLTDPDFPPARYLVSVLNSLGYRASLQIATGDRFNTLSKNSRYQVQVSRGGWAADYPAPSEFLNLFLSCAAFRPASDANDNVAQFCDRDIDRDIEQALSLQATDPAGASSLWATADRRITDQAPWLPTVNLNAVDFLSTRTGGYQFHPQWGILLDQLWVNH